MTAACQALPRSIAEEMLQVVARAICDRPGETAVQRESRARQLVHCTLGFEPRDGLEYMLASMTVGHFHLILDSMRDVFQGQMDSMKARTKTTIVALDRSLLAFVREARLARVRPLATATAAPEPARSEAAVAGPAVAGPAMSEPAAAGPAVAGPPRSDPAVAGPAMSEPAVAGPAGSDQAVEAAPVVEVACSSAMPHPVTPHPVTPHPAMAHPARACRAEARPAMPHPAEARPEPREQSSPDRRIARDNDITAQHFAAFQDALASMAVNLAEARSRDDPASSPRPAAGD
jgi:hypothetical protein